MRLGMTGQTSTGWRPRCRSSHGPALPINAPSAPPGAITFTNPALRHAVPIAQSAGESRRSVVDAVENARHDCQSAEPYGSVPSYFLMVGATGIEPVTPTMSTTAPEQKLRKYGHLRIPHPSFSAPCCQDVPHFRFSEPKRTTM